MHTLLIKRISLLLISVIALGAFTTFANAKIQSGSSKLTTPFGGRVLTTQIPTVTCISPDGGTAPVVLSSNLAGLGSAGVSAATESNQIQKVNNVATGLYKAIPLYTLRGVRQRQPQSGSWVLGTQRLIPNMNVCTTNILGYPLPFPVMQTVKYGTSRPN